MTIHCTTDPRDHPNASKSTLEALAWAAPVAAGFPLLFYAGGVLFTMGFFFSIGLMPLTGFSLTELALNGWLRVAEATLPL